MRPDAQLTALDVWSRDRRRAHHTLLRHRSGSAVSRAMSVLVHSVSRTGLLFEAPMSSLQTGQTVQLDLHQGGAVESEIIWSNGRFYACEFKQALRGRYEHAVSAEAGPEDPSAYPRTYPRGPTRLVPELNFSTATILALGLWALIGCVAYLSI